MKRIPPIPFAVLLIIWLLLNGSVSAGQIVLGSFLSALFLYAVASLKPFRPLVRNWGTAALLACHVFVDILRSNVAVARIILGLVKERKVTSGFLNIPLELRDPHGLFVLAVIVTATPGTAWAGVSPDGRTLSLHVLDLQDEAAWIATIKGRYEKPLMRIFE
jgi:multicomponent K+:H+ antiporter subunit E